VEVALSVAWIVSTAIFIAAYVLLGFYGWAAILIWGFFALPLARATARRLATHGHGLDTSCRTLASRAAWILAAGTLLAGGSPPLLAPYQTPVLSALTVGLLWVVFAGQLVYVGAATQWMVRSLLRPAPARPV
jgi:hypothetical protein